MPFKHLKLSLLDIDGPQSLDNHQSTIDISLLLPGDIILTRSQNTIKIFLRLLLKMEFDHVTVVLRDMSVLEISFFHIKKQNPQNIHLLKKQPLVLRPRISEQQKQIFLDKLQQSIGDRYDVISFLQISYNFVKNKIIGKQIYDDLYQSFKKNNICTDLIMYNLIHSSKNIETILLQSLSQIQFLSLAHFIPDDFKILANKNMFNIIHEQTRQPKRVDRMLMQIIVKRQVKNLRLCLKTLISNQMLVFIHFYKSISSRQEQKSYVLKIIQIIQLYQLVKNHQYNKAILKLLTITNNTRKQQSILTKLLQLYSLSKL